MLLREAAEESDLLQRREALVRAAQAILLGARSVLGAASYEARSRVMHDELVQLRRMSRVVDSARSLQSQLRAAARRQDRHQVRRVAATMSYVQRAMDEQTRRFAAELGEAKVPHELSPRVAQAMHDAFDDARSSLEARVDAAPPMQRFHLQQHARDLGEGAKSTLMRMAGDVDIEFDIGTALEQEQRDQVVRERELVAHPTEAKWRT